MNYEGNTRVRDSVSPEICFSVVNVVFTLAVTRWVPFGRVARDATLSTKERDFGIAAQPIGAGSVRQLVRQIAILGANGCKRP